MPAQNLDSPQKLKTSAIETAILEPPPDSRNTTFARLGREIARHQGIEEHGERKAESQKAGYRISINIASNTMRIYNLKHSSDRPILVDRSGQIDHDSARVSAKDVERFQDVVEAIHRTQQVEL